jgi:hypothetical protein
VLSLTGKQISFEKLDLATEEEKVSLTLFLSFFTFSPCPLLPIQFSFQLDKLFEQHGPFHAVIHFAALKVCVASYRPLVEE